MTLCLSCSYRVKFGYLPWDKCISCRTLAEMEAGRHSLAGYIPPYKRRRQYVPPINKRRQWDYDPRPHYDPPPELNPPPKYDPRPKWKKPQVWWPMRERAECEPLGIDEAKRQGEHWPDYAHELPYGLFNDVGLSYEARANAINQYEIAILSMPDDDWFPPPRSNKRRGRPRKHTTIGRVKYNLQYT